MRKQKREHWNLLAAFSLLRHLSHSLTFPRASPSKSPRSCLAAGRPRKPFFWGRGERAKRKGAAVFFFFFFFFFCNTPMATKDNEKKKLVGAPQSTYFPSLLCRSRKRRIQTLDAQKGRPQARLRLPGPSGQLHPYRPRARRAGPAVRDAGPQGEEAGRAVSVDRPHQRRGEGARGEKLHSSFFGFDYCFRVDVVLPLCGRKREEIGMRANICWQQTSALRFVVVVVDGLGFSSSSAHTSSCLSKKKKKPNSTTAHVLDFHRRAQGRQHRSQPQDPVGLCREGASELRGAGREGPGAAGEGGRRRRRRKQSEGRRRRRRRRWGLKRRERERKTSIFIRALSEMKGL